MDSEKTPGQRLIDRIQEVMGGNLFSGPLTATQAMFQAHEEARMTFHRAALRRAQKAKLN